MGARAAGPMCLLPGGGMYCIQRKQGLARYGARNRFMRGGRIPHRARVPVLGARARRERAPRCAGMRGPRLARVYSAPGRRTATAVRRPGLAIYRRPSHGHGPGDGPSPRRKPRSVSRVTAPAVPQANYSLAVMAARTRIGFVPSGARIPSHPD
jgi:hypothetical protein